MSGNRSAEFCASCNAINLENIAGTSASERKIEIDGVIRGCPIRHSGDSGLFDLHYKPLPGVPENRNEFTK